MNSCRNPFCKNPCCSNRRRNRELLAWKVAAFSAGALLLLAVVFAAIANANPTLTGSGSGPVVRGPSLSDVNFTLNPVVKDTYVSGGSTEESTVDDSVYDVTTGATVDHGWEIFVEQQNVGQFVTPYFESADTDIATVNQQGHVTRVSDGTVAIFARSHWLTRRYDAVVSRETPVTSNVFSHFVSGSVADTATDGVHDRISGLTPATAKPIFTTQNHTAGTYVRNTGCWLAVSPSLVQSATCISPYNSHSGANLGFTLITPRHGIMATHAKFPNGTVVTFVAADNTRYTRTITAQADIGGLSDFTIAKLDSDLPIGISFAKVPPADFADYIPGVANGIHCMASNKSEHAIAIDLKQINSGTIARFDFPHDDDALDFNESVVAGDSGHGAFAIIGNELVFLTLWTYGDGGVGSGRKVWEFIDEINSALTTLGGGYSLTEIDLSSYPDYSFVVPVRREQFYAHDFILAA